MGVSAQGTSRIPVPEGRKVVALQCYNFCPGYSQNLSTRGSMMRKYVLLFIVVAAILAGISTAAVEKDFRYTAVNFIPVDPDTGEIMPAELGDLLPYDDVTETYTVAYVLQGKTGKVASTNPGQLYGVVTITDTGDATAFTIVDSFGDQFNINPGKICGGVDVIRVDADNYAEILTGTEQVSGSVDNELNTVTLDIVLESPLGADEQLMIYCKFKTALKKSLPVWDNFVNTVTVNEESASATVAFV